MSENSTVAAQAQRAGVRHQVLDHGRRHVVLESELEVALLRQSEEVADQRRGREEQHDQQRRIDQVQPQSLAAKKVDGKTEVAGEQHRGEQAASGDAEARQEPYHQQADREHHERVDQRHPLRPLDHAAVEQVLDHVGAQLHARGRAVERGGADVAERRGGAADQHHPVAQQGGIGLALEDVGDRNAREGRAGLAVIAHQQLSLRVEREFPARDLHARHTVVGELQFEFLVR
jgi:hypothetical protein